MILVSFIFYFTLFILCILVYLLSYAKDKKRDRILSVNQNHSRIFTMLAQRTCEGFWKNAALISLTFFPHTKKHNRLAHLSTPETIVHRAQWLATITESIAHHVWMN